MQSVKRYGNRKWRTEMKKEKKKKKREERQAWENNANAIGQWMKQN